jgi:hypothetical protein
MAQSGTDAYGAYTDTGTGTVPAVRANTEIEFHTSLESDTGSKVLPLNQPNQHIPHRSLNSPR